MDWLKIKKTQRAISLKLLDIPITKLVGAIRITVCMGLVACGGGGGSDASPSKPSQPEPEPAPTEPSIPNQAPVISYSISPDTLNEGETFIIDTRESYDPDGEIVSIIIENYFNPYFTDFKALPVNADLHPSGVFEFVVPEVFRDTDFHFNITVEDNLGLSTEATDYLTFRNTINSPKIDGFGGPYRVLDTEKPIRLLGVQLGDIFAVEIDSSDTIGDQQIIIIGTENGIVGRNIINDSTSSVEGKVQSIDTFIPRALTFNLMPVSPNQFAVISEYENAFHWFADLDIGSPDTHMLQQTLNIERPCEFVPRIHTGQDFIWIGQREAGLSVVNMDRYVPSDLPEDTPNSFWARGFIDSIKSRAGGNRSLCHIYPTTLSARISGLHPQTDYLDDLIAVDFDSNELVLLADDSGNDGTYEVVDVLPLETGGAKNLKIVDVHSMFLGISPLHLMVLMSDGIDNGEHRLVVVEQDIDGEISQKVHSFHGGAPTQMIIPWNLFGTEEKSIDWGTDIFILTTSNQAVIFEDASSDLGVISKLPAYKPPQYLDIGPGAGSGVVIDGIFPNYAFQKAILISYPEIRQLKLWVYRD